MTRGGRRRVGADGELHVVDDGAVETKAPAVQQVLGRIVTTLPVSDVSLEAPGIGSVVRQLQLGEMRASPAEPA